MCFSFFYSIPRGLGEEQAVAGIWPAERGLCEGKSGQNFTAWEAAERSQSVPLTAAAQWGPFKWWARGTVGSGHSPLGQQGATDCHNKVFKISRLSWSSPLSQNLGPAMHFWNNVFYLYYYMVHVIVSNILDVDVNVNLQNTSFLAFNFHLFSLQRRSGWTSCSWALNNSYRKPTATWWWSGKRMTWPTRTCWWPTKGMCAAQIKLSNTVLLKVGEG